MLDFNFSNINSFLSIPGAIRVGLMGNLKGNHGKLLPQNNRVFSESSRICNLVIKPGAFVFFLKCTKGN